MLNPKPNLINMPKSFHHQLPHKGPKTNPFNSSNPKRRGPTNPAPINNPGINPPKHPNPKKDHPIPWTHKPTGTWNQTPKLAKPAKYLINMSKTTNVYKYQAKTPKTRTTEIKTRATVIRIRTTRTTVLRIGSGKSLSTINRRCMNLLPKVVRFACSRSRIWHITGRSNA